MKVSSFIYYFRFFLFLFLATAAISLAHTESVVAAGFGVSPSSLDFVVEKGSAASRQLIVYNTGADARFTAISEDPAIAIVPSEGLLGKGKSAAVTVTAAGKKSGKSSSEILISFITNNGRADKEVQFSLGTRVGVSLNVFENSLSSLPPANFFVGILTSVVIVATGLSAYLPVRNRLKRPVASGWRRTEWKRA